MFDKEKMSRFVAHMDIMPTEAHLTYVIKIQHNEKVIMRNQLMYPNQQEQNTMFICVDAKQDF